MELTHRFTVPLPLEETWEKFAADGAVADLAECFPGATVTEAEGDSFKGTVKVKLGPIALVYAGSGTFTEKDVTARRLVVEAKGRDKRGNGTAGATATLTMTEADAGGSAATDVEVHTDLAVTGKPAQFGRGVMQDVSDKLLGQFTECLEQRSAAPAEEPPQADAAAAGPAAESTRPDSPSSGASGAGVAASAGPRPGAPAGGEDSLDLGATVLPVLVRSYWKPALAGLTALIILRALVRRLRR